MAILKSSSILYASLVLLLTLAIVLNENALQSQSGNMQKIDLNRLAQTEGEFELEQDTPEYKVDSALFAQAINHGRQGEPELAIAKYQKILSVHGNHQMAAINLAILLKKTQGCENSRALMEHAVLVSRAKRKAKAHALLASCLSEMGEQRLALKHIGQSILFRPNHGKTWLKQARMESLAKLSYTQVLGSYHKAMALDSKNKSLRLEVAGFQYRHLDFNGSIKTLRSKYKLLKSSIKANKLLAWSYLELGKVNNARKYAHRVKNLQSRVSVFSDAFDFYLDGKPEQSITAIKALKSKRGENRYLLALNYQHKKWPNHATTQLMKLKNSSQYDYLSDWRLLQLKNKKLTDKQKIAAYQNLLSQNIHKGRVALEAAQVAKSQGEIDSALKFILLAKKTEMINKKIERLYGELLWLNGEQDKAIDQLGFLNDHFSGSRIIKRQLANYLSEQKQVSQALMVLGQIHSSDLKNSDLILIATLLVKDGQLQDAIGNLLELLERDDKDIEARFMLAKLLKQSGDTSASKKQLGLLLALAPTFKPAQQMLAE